MGCGECQDGFLIGFGGKCYLSCPKEGQSFDTEANRCSDCSDMTYGCLSCEPGSMKCTGCQNGYKFDDKKNKCVKECKKVSEALDEKLNKCVVCSEITEGCSECQDQSLKCTRCIDHQKWELDQESNKCLRKCDVGGGEAWVPPNTCQKCGKHCERCQKLTRTCEKCDEGYRLDQSKSEVDCVFQDPKKEQEKIKEPQSDESDRGEKSETQKEIGKTPKKDKEEEDGGKLTKNNR